MFFSVFMRFIVSNCSIHVVVFSIIFLGRDVSAFVPFCPAQYNVMWSVRRVMILFLCPFTTFVVKIIGRGDSGIC